jgi:hypothetical protein
MNDNEALSELDTRIAAIRENLRELFEQAAAYSGAADEERNADRIANQEAKLEALLKKRDALLDGSSLNSTDRTMPIGENDYKSIRDPRIDRLTADLEVFRPIGH